MKPFNLRKFSNLPPEGLWISPTGERINAVEHLESIRNYPEQFNLSPQDTNTNDIQQLRNIGENLIRSGWIRYRQLDMTFFFEVNSVEASKNLILDVLQDASSFPQGERVEISQLTPVKTFAGTVEDFYNNKLTITARKDLPNLSKWAWSENA